MKTGTEKLVVSWLLTNAAIRMLADAERSGPIQKAAKQQHAALRAKCSPEELGGVELMAKAFVGLAKKLAACQDVEALEQAVQYVADLRDGNVLIAMPDGSYDVAN
jgi:hypothetical protein